MFKWLLVDSRKIYRIFFTVYGGAVSGLNAGPVNGVLARLRGVTSREPTGAGWDIVVGGGWKQVCVRGR